MITILLSFSNQIMGYFSKKDFTVEISVEFFHN